MMFSFFFNAAATTEIYTLSLHDALPIWILATAGVVRADRRADLIAGEQQLCFPLALLDRKSTRLNSSHSQISYAVFCLKKKKRNPRAPCSPKTTIAFTMCCQSNM